MPEDRRVRKTRQRIQEAMLRCLQTTPLQSVTVKAICAEADINRSTFYAHYADPFVLYEELQAKTVEELSHSLDHLAGETAAPSRCCLTGCAGAPRSLPRTWPTCSCG